MIKLVIWDLDETLWRGTLADGDAVRLFDHRADLIRDLNRHGVVSSICSKNDPAVARDKLIELGLWDEFVFPRIAFGSKAEAIASIIVDMQLRAADVLFVDDNPLNLHEARFHLPDLQLLDIREADADAVLHAILKDQPASRSRLAEYRNLERKHLDRHTAAAVSDEEFLRSCEIRACAPAMMANLDFIDRIVELINRSNQLNYAQSRVDRDSLKRDMIDGYLEYYCWSIFAWDKYGNHGLVGFVMMHRGDRTLKHFAFSCRIMNMGIESYALRKVREYFPNVVVPDGWHDRIGRNTADWIADQSYDDPETRQTLFASQGHAVAREANLRIMYACQSGGLAHYSRFREQIDFDIHPRLFALRDFVYEYSGPDLPPFLVYGAGIDYKDEAWGDLADQLDEGLYAQCVRRLCAHLEKRGRQALILLPPEHLERHRYCPAGLTRERTTIYNALWRKIVADFPGLAVLDIDRVCQPEELVDVNHLRPPALQAITTLIDVWYGHASGASEGQWTEAA